MRTIALLATLLILIVAPLRAGEIGYASAESCTVAADVVSCVTTAGRGSMVVESSEAAFINLRNALTPGWDGSGDVICGRCYVKATPPLLGCTSTGQVVNTTRKKHALAELACMLRVTVIQADRRTRRGAADAAVDENPDIGGGDPG